VVIVFVVLASSFVPLGTYLLSSALVPIPAIAKYIEFFQSKFLLLAIGISLNLAGSLFWFLGRRFFSSYAFAWSLYLGLLVAFGTLIAVIIEDERLIAPQFAGLVLLFISLLLLKK